MKSESSTPVSIRELNKHCCVNCNLMKILPPSRKACAAKAAGSGRAGGGSGVRGGRLSSPQLLPRCCRFHHTCISRWAEIESKCPFCKERFATLRRKQLAPGAAAVARSNPNTELPGVYLDSLAVPERDQV